MSKLNQVWVVSSGNPAEELLAGAAALGERVVLVLAGNRPDTVNADVLFYLGLLGDNKSFLNVLPSMASLVVVEKPDLILTDTSLDGRIAAAFLSAALNTNVFTDVIELWIENGAVCSKRMVYGGKGIQSERADGPAVVCVGPGILEGSDIPKKLSSIIDVDIGSGMGIVCKGKVAKETEQVDLGMAKKVVSVGRGLGNVENLPLVRSLADSLGAELACSRPVAEEEKWMPKERYVGISGAIIKPELYVAIGISGQVQHMVGINHAGTIVAINKDAGAVMFQNCDYGVVGDFKEILPRLVNKLNGKG